MYTYIYIYILEFSAALRAARILKFKHFSKPNIISGPSFSIELTRRTYFSILFWRTGCQNSKSCLKNI